MYIYVYIYDYVIMERFIVYIVYVIYHISYIVSIFLYIVCFKIMTTVIIIYC